MAGARKAPPSVRCSPRAICRKARLNRLRWHVELQRITTSPENAYRIYEALSTIDVRPLLSQVRVPTLVLHCRNEIGVSFSEGRDLAAGIPGARFVPLEGQNHLLLETEPAFPRFLAEVRAFLA